MPDAAAPVPGSQRSLAIDACRGLGILGILVVNIQFFAMGIGHVPHDPQPADWFVRDLVGVLFESKFVSIFSLLFGAGIVLMDRGALKRAESWWHRYYTRTGILLVVGFLHAYLLWYGDILFTYALIGFVIFWLRRLPPVLLLALGAAIYVVGLGVTGWMVAIEGETYPVPHTVEFFLARLSPATRIGTYALAAIYYQTLIFLFFSCWFNTGLMLVGMALCRWGFFEGKWRTRSYALTALGAFAVALPLILLARTTLERGQITNLAWMYANTFFAPVLALGYCSILILACTRLKPNPITHALGAAGRMALTNYLLQSVVCVVVFYRLGLIGRVADAQTFAICWVILLAQLVLSPLWLRSFRFGPMEWLWRSLTYGRVQPLRINRATPT